MYRILALILSSLTLILLTIFLLFDRNSSNGNIINKVNAVNNQWINYEGKIPKDYHMIQSQFIPLNTEESYLLNKDAYVSYYNGENFIKTELHDGKSELENVKEADGVIISFNKDNKNGIKLINEE